MKNKSQKFYNDLLLFQYIFLAKVDNVLLCKILILPFFFFCFNIYGDTFDRMLAWKFVEKN